MLVGVVEHAGSRSASIGPASSSGARGEVVVVVAGHRRAAATPRLGARARGGERVVAGERDVLELGPGRRPPTSGTLSDEPHAAVAARRRRGCGSARRAPRAPGSRSAAGRARRGRRAPASSKSSNGCASVRWSMRASGPSRCRARRRAGSRRASARARQKITDVPSGAATARQRPPRRAAPVLGRIGACSASRAGRGGLRVGGLEGERDDPRVVPGAVAAVDHDRARRPAPTAGRAWSGAGRYG